MTITGNAPSRTGADQGEPSGQVPAATGLIRHGRRWRWPQLAAVIAALWAGGFALGLLGLSLRGGGSDDEVVLSGLVTGRATPDDAPESGAASAELQYATDSPLTGRPSSSSPALPAPAAPALVQGTTATTTSASTTAAPTSAAPTTTAPTTTAPTTTAPTTRAPTTAAPAPTVTAPAGAGQAQQILALVNNERAAAGCAALQLDGSLTAAATAHSLDMANQGYFNHTGLDGSQPWDRARAAGIAGSGIGENIAAGYPSAEAVMAGWMNSSGHRSNILNCGYRYLGVGYAEKGNHWTQLFGG